MIDKVDCVLVGEGEILIAENLCKIVFSVEIEGSDISHIGGPVIEHLALMYREIAIYTPLFLSE